jgi:hypothetical protein
MNIIYVMSRMNAWDTHAQWEVHSTWTNRKQAEQHQELLKKHHKWGEHLGNCYKIEFFPLYGEQYE